MRRRGQTNVVLVFTIFPLLKLMTRPVVCHCQCNEMSKINYETHKLGSRLDDTLGARARRPNFASSIDSGMRKSVNSDLDSCHSSEVSIISGGR